MNSRRNTSSYPSNFPGFSATQEGPQKQLVNRPWKILIVDDEEEVHAVTRMVLADFEFDGRTLELLSATSADEAKRLLVETRDIAVTLLDVVMGDDDSGLQLVKFIREELGNPRIRIVIRTGQPGYAPEKNIILDYDINDYTEKVLLTSTRLISTVVSSLRAYRDLITLEHYSAELHAINIENVRIQTRLEDANSQLEEKVRELESTQQALDQSKNWLSTVLNSVGDGVVAVDFEERVVLMNPVAENLTGWNTQEAKGQLLKDVIRLLDVDTIRPTDIDSLQWNDGRGGYAPALLLPKDGKRRFVAFSCSPIIDELGTELGEVFVFRDITENMRLEAQLKQQQKLEALGTLSSGVAHEIKNPLTVILNSAELLQRKCQTGELNHFTEKIVRETERVAKIVTNMLAFARQELVEDPFEAAHLKDIIEAVLSIMQSVIKKDGISLELDIPEHLPPVNCRSQQIQQVIMNLLTNARDAVNARFPHQEDERKTIQISCREIVRKNQLWVRTTVKDRGEGIRPSVVPRIFDPFFTTKPRGTGTGLGLSVSHGIITDHGGELRVESQRGEFTEFHMDLKAIS